MEFTQLALTLLCACAVGLLLDRLRVPGGMMIGAVIGACALNLATGNACMPPIAKTCAQIIAGAFIGSGVRRADVRAMRAVYKPACILLPGLLIVNIAAGYAMHAAGGIDLLTALFASTPGGISDIPLIAADLGADAGVVTVLQFIRFLMGIALFPALIRLMSGERAGEKRVKGKRNRAPGTPVAMAITLAVAAACGLAGKFSGMPGGTMALATLGTIALKWFFPPTWTPRGLRKAAQLMSGAFVGASMGAKELSTLGTLWLPALLLLTCYMLGAYLIALALRKAKCFDFKESLLAATPAGASDMALISADLGVKNVGLVILQVLRLVVVISLFPSILSLIAGR